MVFRLYLSPGIREKYIHDYDVLLNNFNLTYRLMYEEVKEHSTQAFEKYHREGEIIITKGIHYHPEHVDPSEYYEKIQDYAIDRMAEQSLMYYQFKLMALSNLYQVFEQQLRKWLFKEMTHNHNEYINQLKFIFKDEEKEYGEFFSHFKALSELLTELNLTFSVPVSPLGVNVELKSWFMEREEQYIEDSIVNTEIWELIRECNLISNTFKHGSGPAAKTLYKARPEYFEEVNETKLMNLYLTTNLEEVLRIDEISFGKYVAAIKQFWEKIKIHQSGSLELMVNISPGKAAQN